MKSHSIRNFIIGTPLPNSMLGEKRLNKVRALAAFSPDALSSIAYANQEIYLGLVIAGAAGLAFSFPIAIAIALLLAIVALSYTQTIRAYPSGGGSYLVAKENLGLFPGLVAAGALLLDYILTAAVSITAGVAEIASAFPGLLPYRTSIAIGLLVVITLLNLRGLKESGTVMALPVYLFLVAFIGMIFFGGTQILLNNLHPVPLVNTAPPAFQGLTLMVILHAFAAGCTALTGIEAISNGVPAFTPPEWLNARKTLVVMACLMAFLFLGSIGLTQYLGVVPQGQETILSALTHRIFGNSIFYYLVQFSTLMILAVAANTSFAGFPRVAAILASDRFLPRQLFNLGDRLVFNNGILLLSGLSALLIVLFRGESHLLVPLFAIGAFSAFTLSQAGMVRHWMRERKSGWLIKALINGLGSLVTLIALLIVGISKITHGAWISILIILVFLWIFWKIHQHYQQISGQLSLRGLPPSLRPSPTQRVVIPVSGIHRGMVDAVNFARSISNQVTAVYIDTEPGPDEDELRREWKEWFPDVEFVVVDSPYRSIVDPLLNFLDKTDQEHNDGQQAVLILPELVPAHAWQTALHNQSANAIKKALLFHRRQNGFQRVIIDVPYHLNDPLPENHVRRTRWEKKSLHPNEPDQ